MLTEAIDLHFKHNCFATFTPIIGINGGILKIPANVIDNIPKSETVYETDDEKLTVYYYGKKTHEIKCPKYAMRLLILANILCKMDNQAFSSYLIKSLDKDGKEKDYTNKGFGVFANTVDSIDLKLSNKDKRLEDKMISLFEELITDGETSVVSEDVLEGFRIVSEHYVSEFNN